MMFCVYGISDLESEWNEQIELIITMIDQKYPHTDTNF